MKKRRVTAGVLQVWARAKSFYAPLWICQIKSYQRPWLVCQPPQRTSGPSNESPKWEGSNLAERPGPGSVHTIHHQLSMRQRADVSWLKCYSWRKISHGNWVGFCAQSLSSNFRVISTAGETVNKRRWYHLRPLSHSEEDTLQLIKLSLPTTIITSTFTEAMGVRNSADPLHILTVAWFFK